MASAEGLSLLEFFEDIVDEIARLSRTYQTGIVNTGSAGQKAKLGLKPKPREKLTSGIAEAVDVLSCYKPSRLSVELLSRVNGILRGEGEGDSGILRTWEVPELGYLPVVDIEKDLHAFVMRASKQCEESTEAEAYARLFDVHRSINLRGHYFADACGRTATVVGGWITVRIVGQVLPLPNRAKYLSSLTFEDPLQAFMTNGRLLRTSIID